MTPAARPVLALIVDDSAVAREALTHALVGGGGCGGGGGGGIEVMTAPNAAVAFEKIRIRRPDVIVLDLEMPGMLGLEFLERLMQSNPIPVVVCSGAAQPGAMAALRALELGAVEVVQKPTTSLREFFVEGGGSLAALVRGAATARLRPALSVPATSRAASVTRSSHPRRAGRTSDTRLIVLGASTGGTEALRHVLSLLPADAPPVLVVQHMPGAFTTAFAARLDALCALRVREAVDGDRLEPGIVLVAPGGRHLEVQRVEIGMVARVHRGPLVTGHRPSVDVLFMSAARVARGAAIAALLTGMGTDGARGMLRLREAGAHTIAQDEESCVVFGMPRAAIELGAVAEVLPLPEIAGAIFARTQDREAIRR
jgi:two-component system, chemotaxis family, protein-glutamate methylesterase/glutaminase